MEQKTIDKLVERLGMASALAPLLNSGNGYEKFEEALNDSLNESLGMMPKIKVKATAFLRNGTRVLKSEAYNVPIVPSDCGFVMGEGILKEGISRGPAIITKGMTPQKYGEAVDMFRKYFGLGEGRVSMGEIASRYDVTRGFVGQNVDFVAKYLKQRFSKDLWYGTL